MRRVAKYVLIVGSLVAVAGAVVIAAQSQQQRQFFGKRGRGAPDAPVPVLAAQAKLADVPVYLDGVGTIKALNTVTVRPQVDGKLMRILFKEGQDVERGYVLAEIDPITYQALFDQVTAKKAQDEAQLANARLDLERYNRLVASNSATRQQADTQKAMVAQLEAQVKLDQAAIDNAQAILGYTKIIAPISGRTGIRMVDEGNLIRAGDASTGIVMITQIKPLSVFFSLPQQQLARVNRAFAREPLVVEALGSDNKSVVDRGTLQVVDNQVDQTTGTVKLKAEFPNADLQLWPGQFVNVRLLIETLHQVVTVPTAAVQRGPNGTFVYVMNEDAVAVRPVTVSQQDDAQAVVTSGLKAQDRVVTTGFARISDGTKVAAANADETPPPAASSEPPRRGRRGGPKS
ncbi:MAG: efflux RND transporter periplasmic adaptor subunit [Xanthobacteraceae bacterium]|jgi:membrane fusion protein, multidrug efflux system